MQANLSTCKMLVDIRGILSFSKKSQLLMVPERIGRDNINKFRYNLTNIAITLFTFDDAKA